MLRKQKVVGAIVAICCLLIPATSVFAVSSGGFGGRPANPDPANPRTESIFIYTIKGGENKEDQVLVSNNSDEEVTIALYAVDGVTTNTGAYTCRQASEARVGVGEWLKLSEETLTLGPTESKKVDFTLTMPENADVGEHNGCIVFENANDEGEVVNGGAVRLRTRSAIRVVATIPGELKRNVEVASFGAQAGERGKQAFALTLQNNGNVSADVDTKVTLTDMFGNIIYENGGGYPVFANQKLDLSFTNTERPFWGGWFTARASISYDKRAGTFGTDNKNELITKNASDIRLFIMPSPMAMLIILTPILLIAGVLIGLLARRITRRRTKKEWGTYEVLPGDTIESIAATHNTSWKKLASINGVKAPYSVKEGTTLKVPGAAAALAPAEPVLKVKRVDAAVGDEIDALLDEKPKATRREPKKPGHKHTTKRT